MILVIFMLLGLALRLASGRSLRSLATVKLRGETVLVVLLVGQVVLPGLHVSGVWATVAHWAWVGTFLVLVALAWINRRQPGMALLGAGFASNSLVVLANGGMPVLPAAAATVSGSAARIHIPASDFVHVLAGPGTRLVWLADAIPLPGPAGVRALLSAGDVLLFAGLVVLLALAQGNSPKPGTPAS